MLVKSWIRKIELVVEGDYSDADNRPGAIINSDGGVSSSGLRWLGEIHRAAIHEEELGQGQKPIDLIENCWSHPKRIIYQSWRRQPEKGDPDIRVQGQRREFGWNVIKMIRLRSSYIEFYLFRDSPLCFNKNKRKNYPRDYLFTFDIKSSHFLPFSYRNPLSPKISYRKVIRPSIPKNQSAKSFSRYYHTCESLFDKTLEPKLFFSHKLLWNNLESFFYVRNFL